MAYYPGDVSQMSSGYSYSSYPHSSYSTGGSGGVNNVGAGEFYELPMFHPWDTPCRSIAFDGGGGDSGASSSATSASNMLFIGSDYSSQRGVGGLKSRCQLGSFVLETTPSTSSSPPTPSTTTFTPYAYNVASTIPSTTTHHKGIVALLPLSPIILAATNEGVAMFNSGCMRQGDYNLQQPNQTNQSSVQTNLTDTPVDLCTNEAVYDGPNQVVTHATVATRMGKLKVRTNGLK